MDSMSKKSKIAQWMVAQTRLVVYIREKKPLPLPLPEVATVKYLTAFFLVDRVHLALWRLKTLDVCCPNLPCSQGTSKWYNDGQWDRKAVYCRLAGNIYFFLNKQCSWKRNHCPFLPTFGYCPMKVLLSYYSHLVTMSLRPEKLT